MRRDILAELGARVMLRRMKLSRRPVRFRVQRSLPVPMRDGVELLADHYGPSTRKPAGTVLIRTPYGRDGLPTRVIAGVYAAYGFHVALQSTRGTFGSGGEFEPGRHEVEDGADTADWLRVQSWFTGDFVTVGASYLGYTQLALLVDQPADLATSVITMAPHDFGQSVWGTGSFALGDFLGWTYQVGIQHDGGWIRQMVRGNAIRRTLRPALSALPVSQAADDLLAGRTPWFTSWLGHDDPAAPYWQGLRVDHALDRLSGPLLLITGWQDAFLEQTMEQYRRLRERGIDVALTVGPWTHGDGGTEALRESLEWLDGARRIGAPVRVCTNDGDWLELQDWPPPSGEQVLYLHPGEALTDAPSRGGQPSTFVYNPIDPTPSIGGRLLVSGKSGYVDDTELAHRSDVLCFTGPALADDVETLGAPIVELTHSTANPHADVYVRISDVAPDGRSRNVSDGYLRLTVPTVGPLRIELDPTAYRFRAGHRIRLLIAGGCYPRFARNLGTGEPVGSGTRMVSVVHTVAHGDGGQSRLILPVSAR
ncbi:putative CocE/NonD family hydrolase [Mycobacterium sp. MAA66]|uniref:CocE/NonD family hydrolase n=1 Tax=Mycobacterium sp. MAA66 TaxID=3156297 RepID=UPI00351451DA